MFLCDYTHSNKHSLKGGCKVFGHSVVAEVVATVSRHVLHLPLTPTVLRQLPEFQLLWERNAQSQAAAITFLLSEVQFQELVSKMLNYSFKNEHKCSSVWLI